MCMVASVASKEDGEEKLKHNKLAMLQFWELILEIILAEPKFRKEWNAGLTEPRE